MVGTFASTSYKGFGIAFEASFKGIGAFNSSSSIIVGKTMAFGHRMVGINSYIGMDSEQAAGPTASFRFSYRFMEYGALSYSSLQVQEQEPPLED